MKKTASFVLFAMLAALAGASSATVHVECKRDHGKCLAPVAPTPPAPPAPPALPTVPPVPVIPAPPPPPKVPDVPAAAHAACAGKAPGTGLTYTIGQGEYMRGVCEREDGKMQFMLRVYHAE